MRARSAKAPAARREPVPWLAPLGWLYLLAARTHHAGFDYGLRRASGAGVPVVSVGNLTVGGTGKTPTVQWLAAALNDRGLRIGIVSRGYGGRRKVDPLVVARDGERLATARECGDEPALLADSTPAGVVVVGRDRTAAARLAAAEGARVVLLDDGFQHRRLRRDFDLVLADALDPFGGGRGLPAGPLREPPSAIARADAVLLTRSPARLLETSEPIEQRLLPPDLARSLSRSSGPPPPVFAAGHSPSRLLMPSGAPAPLDALRGTPVLAVCGVARPESFVETLTGLGADVKARLAWPDHHPYGPGDLRAIREAKTSSGASLVVTTAKDAVRWPDPDERPAVLEITLRLPAGPALLERVLAAIESAEAGS